jgi:hypothetical protein
MGVSSSKFNKKYDTDTFVNAEQKARKIYNYRIKTYDPLIHGPRENYIMRVEAEFELNCIPEYMRHGS